MLFDICDRVRKRNRQVSAPLSMTFQTLSEVSYGIKGEGVQNLISSEIFPILGSRVVQTLSRAELVSLKMTARRIQLGFALFNRGLDRYTV